MLVIIFGKSYSSGVFIYITLEFYMQLPVTDVCTGCVCVWMREALLGFPGSITSHWRETSSQSSLDYDTIS